jgi:hypothetical protein
MIDISIFFILLFLCAGKDATGRHKSKIQLLYRSPKYKVPKKKKP